MKAFKGKVISTQMKNTVVVEVFRVTPHPLYKKLVRLSKKYKVDNTGFENVTVGSVVKIAETKPISKYKYFKISEVVSMGEGFIIVKEEEKSKKASEKEEIKAEAKIVKTPKAEVKPVVKKTAKKTIKPSEVKTSKDKKETK